MKKLLVTLIFVALPVMLLAQDVSTISVGQEDVTYSEVVEEGGVSYYYNNDNSLVLSAHDGIWIVYKANDVILEAHDTNSDGTPDVFFELNNEEDVVSVGGEGAIKFERPEITTFENLIKEDGPTDSDLVGDLSGITIPKGTNWFLWILILSIIGGAYYYWNTKKGN